MMRLGRILCINLVEGTGLILDENDQDITFLLEGLNQKVRLSDEVRFEIAITSLGLIATNINPIVF